MKPRALLLLVASLLVADSQARHAAEGGSGGGSVLVEGTPEKVAATKKSYTGQFLRPLLGMD
jgi:excinuclease UvrABC ATPase subunit